MNKEKLKKARRNLRKVKGKIMFKKFEERYLWKIWRTYKEIRAKIWRKVGKKGNTKNY